MTERSTYAGVVASLSEAIRRGKIDDNRFGILMKSITEKAAGQDGFEKYLLPPDGRTDTVASAKRSEADLLFLLQKAGFADVTEVRRAATRMSVMPSTFRINRIDLAVPAFEFSFNDLPDYLGPLTLPHLPFNDFICFVDSPYGTIHLFHFAANTSGETDVIGFFRNADGAWSQSPCELTISAEGSLKLPENFLEVHDLRGHCYLAAQLVAILLHERHTTVLAPLGPHAQRENAKRISRGRNALPPHNLVIIDKTRPRIILNGYRAPYSATPKRPHDRAGHWCTNKNGRRFWRSAAKIHGGGESPPNYRVKGPRSG